MGVLPNLVRSWERTCGRSEPRSVLELAVRNGRIVEAKVLRGGRRAECISKEARRAVLDVTGLANPAQICLFLEIPKPPLRQ